MSKTVFEGPNKIVVKALRDAREAAGLTQRQLAEKIGRDQSHISLIEMSQRRLDVVEFDNIARALGVDPVELFATISREIAKAGAR